MTEAGGIGEGKVSGERPCIATHEHRHREHAVDDDMVVRVEP